MNLVNGKSSSSISIFDRGFLYGDSVFETILVVNNQPKNLDEHIKRIKSGCKVLKIRNLDINLLYKHIKKCLKGVRNCSLSINITRGTVKRRGYSIRVGNIKPNIILTTSALHKYPKIYTQKGIKTKFAKSNISDCNNLSKIKHTNRLEQVLATSEITQAYPELILCDKKGYVIEGIASNIFFVKNNTFYTPLIEQSGVEGIMKLNIIKILKKNKIKVIQKKIKKNTITNYDGAFFCNSIRLIWNINSIEGHKYKSNKNIINLINIINYEAYK